MMGFLEAAGLFRDTWRLYRKYFGQNKSREMWERFVEDAEGIYEKYGKRPFAKDLMITVISEVERIEKEANFTECGRIRGYEDLRKVQGNDNRGI